MFFFLLSDVKAANGRFTPWVAFITWSFGAKLLSYIIVFMYYDTAFFCVFWLHRWNENLQAQSNQANIVRAQGILFFTITLPLSFYCEMNVSSLRYSVTKKEAVFLSIKRSKLPGMTRIWWCCKKRRKRLRAATFPLLLSLSVPITGINGRFNKEEALCS